MDNTDQPRNRHRPSSTPRWTPNARSVPAPKPAPVAAPAPVWQQSLGSQATAYRPASIDSVGPTSLGQNIRPNTSTDAGLSQPAAWRHPLAAEPVAPPAPARTARPTVAPPPTNSSDASALAIQINLPELHLPDLRRIIQPTAAAVRRLARAYQALNGTGVRRLRPILLASLAGLLLTAGLWQGSQYLTRRAAVAQAKAVTSQAKAARATPSFTPLAPADSKNNEANGRPQAAYDSSRNTYSFTDTIKGQAVVVSQQPVPGSFADATAAVAKIAGTLAAKQSVQTDNGTAYIATDPKANSQTVVFTKNQLLVFVQSPFSHTTTEWQSYINDLKS